MKKPLVTRMFFLGLSLMRDMFSLCLTDCRPSHLQLCKHKQSFWGKYQKSPFGGWLIFYYTVVVSFCLLSVFTHNSHPRFDSCFLPPSSKSFHHLWHFPSVTLGLLWIVVVAALTVTEGTPERPSLCVSHKSIFQTWSFCFV